MIHPKDLAILLLFMYFFRFDVENMPEKHVDLYKCISPHVLIMVKIYI